MKFAKCVRSWGNQYIKGNVYRVVGKPSVVERIKYPNATWVIRDEFGKTILVFSVDGSQSQERQKKNFK